MWLTAREAAAIIGCKTQHVYRLVSEGELPKAVRHQKRGLALADVEVASLARWAPGHSYWVTTAEAAEVLGVTPNRVRQLVYADRLPFVRHGDRMLPARPG